MHSTRPLGLPIEHAARIALRTQQILAEESGVTDTVDPLAGSYYVEALTDELERLALGLIDQVDQRGGAVAAIEQGFPQGEIEESAYQVARRIESSEDVVVGVNGYVDADPTEIAILEIDPALEEAQADRVRAAKINRDQSEVDALLAQLGGVAATDSNLLYPMKASLVAGATLGEVSDVLRGAFGIYRSG